MTLKERCERTKDELAAVFALMEADEEQDVSIVSMLQRSLENQLSIMEALELLTTGMVRKTDLDVQKQANNELRKRLLAATKFPCIHETSTNDYCDYCPAQDLLSKELSFQVEDAMCSLDKNYSK